MNGVCISQIPNHLHIMASSFTAWLRSPAAREYFFVRIR